MIRFTDGMSGYLTAGGYYAPAMSLQAAGLTSGTAGLTAIAAAAPPTVSQTATGNADGRLQ